MLRTEQTNSPAVDVSFQLTGHLSFNSELLGIIFYPFLLLPLFGVVFYLAESVMNGARPEATMVLFTNSSSPPFLSILL